MTARTNRVQSPPLLRTIVAIGGMCIVLGFSAEIYIVSLETGVLIPPVYYSLAVAMVVCPLGGSHVKHFFTSVRKVGRWTVRNRTS